MRIATVLLLGLALYFGAGLLWPARYEGPRYVPPAAADSPAVRALHARPLAADAASYADVAVELYALQQREDALAYSHWMQARAWRRFLGRDEPALANVGEAIEAGRGGEAELATLRADVLARVVAVRVDTALAPAMLDLFASSEDLSRGRTINAVVPGLWSIDVDGYHDLRTAVKVRNLASAPLASTPFAPVRLVVAWDGERDKSLRCESVGGSRFEPGLEITLWCRSMADLGWKTDSKPIDWIRSGRSNDEHRLELVAEASSLAIPALDLSVRRDGNDYRTPEVDRLAELARHRADERSCFERGTCTREMFDNTGHWRATLVWALAALAVCVTASSVGRSFALAVLLALLTTFNAGARALVAAAGDVQPFPLWRSLLWLAACLGIAALAWTLRAPLSDWRAMRERPRPELVYERFAASVSILAMVGMLLFGAYLMWMLCITFRR